MSWCIKCIQLRRYTSYKYIKHLNNMFVQRVPYWLYYLIQLENTIIMYFKSGIFGLKCGKYEDNRFLECGALYFGRHVSCLKGT